MPPSVSLVPIAPPSTPTGPEPAAEESSRRAVADAAIVPGSGSRGSPGTVQLLPVGVGQVLAHWELHPSGVEFFQQTTGAAAELQLALRVHSSPDCRAVAEVPLHGLSGDQAVALPVNVRGQLVATVGALDARGRFIPGPQSLPITPFSEALPVLPPATATAPEHRANVLRRIPAVGIALPAGLAGSVDRLVEESIGRPLAGPPAPTVSSLTEAPLSPTSSQQPILAEPGRHIAVDPQQTGERFSSVEATAPTTFQTGVAESVLCERTADAVVRERLRAGGRVVAVELGLNLPVSTGWVPVDDPLETLSEDSASRAQGGTVSTASPGLAGSNLRVEPAPGFTSSLPTEADPQSASFPAAAVTAAGPGGGHPSASGSGLAGASGQLAGDASVTAVVVVEGTLQPGFDLWLFGQRVTLLPEGRVHFSQTFRGWHQCSPWFSAAAAEIGAGAQLGTKGVADGPLLTVAPTGQEAILSLRACCHLSGWQPGRPPSAYPHFASAFLPGGAFGEVLGEKTGPTMLTIALPYGALILGGCWLGRSQ